MITVMVSCNAQDSSPLSLAEEAPLTLEQLARQIEDLLNQKQEETVIVYFTVLLFIVILMIVAIIVLNYLKDNSHASTRATLHCAAQRLTEEGELRAMKVDKAAEKRAVLLVLKTKSLCESVIAEVREAAKAAKARTAVMMDVLDSINNGNHFVLEEYVFSKCPTMFSKMRALVALCMSLLHLQQTQREMALPAEYIVLEMPELD